MREIKFRFFTPDRRMLDDHDGWTEGIGINEALKCSSEYGYKIMQFTGLKDKNGKEIFEGDLLMYPSDDNVNFTAYEVFFHDGDANSDYNIGFSINRVHHKGNIAGGFIPSFKPKTTAQMIVIGNIYQDKHLIGL